MLGVAAKLRVPLPGGDLQVVVVDPVGDPLHVAVAGQELSSQAEAAQAPVEVAEGLLGQGGHGVAVEGKQGKVGDAVKGLHGQHLDHVETEVQDLKIKKIKSKLLKNREDLRKYIGDAISREKQQ